MSDTPAEPSPPPAPPSSGVALDPLPGDWQRVSFRYVIVDVVSSLVTGVVVAAVAWFFTWIVRSPIGFWAPLAILVITLVYALFTRRRVRAIGYRMRDDDLVVRRGILFRRIVAVPYGRMQLVDVTQGPVDRALGLSQLKLVTAAAASNVGIPGLPTRDAEELRDRLVALAETRRAGL